jgi:hypothetical protein
MVLKVAWITVTAALIGIFAKVFGHSSSAMYLTIISSVLTVNWFFGYASSYRTRKDLATMNFRNLNGSLNFEALMIFSQLQVLFLVLVFIFAYEQFKNMFIELKSLKMLAAQNDGEAWNETFQYGNPMII